MMKYDKNICMQNKQGENIEQTFKYEETHVEKSKISKLHLKRFRPYH